MMEDPNTPHPKRRQTRNNRSCIFCRSSHKTCEEHPARPGHFDSCPLCMYPYLCQQHPKCKRCLVKGLACGPYEYAEETTEYLQGQPQRSIIPGLFPQASYPSQGVDVGQSPYLDATLQGGSVSAMLPGSQGSALNNVMGNDRVPTRSSDMQDPSHNTAPGSIDPLMLFADARIRTPPTEHSQSQASGSEDHESEIISPFVDCDLLRIVQKYVAAVSDVLQHQGLDGDVYHDINEKKETIERDMCEVLKRMQGSLEQAHQGGRIDQVRWMCPRLRTAINDTNLLTNVERTGLMLKINELYTKYKDVSGADSITQDLLHSDCINASSEPKATALFVGSVQNSLERGSGSLKKLKDIVPPFHRLAELGNPDLFTLLEQEAASGKTPEKDFINQTLIHVAAANGHDGLIEHLIYLDDNYPGFHMDIEERDDAGRTAVYLAISHGQWSAYRWLRDHNASLRVRSIAGHSPLAMAARGNHVAIVEDLIVNESCPVNEKVLHAMGGCPPLHIAAERGHWDVVRVLLRHGADRDFRRMRDGKTPAELARSSGHSNLADYIDKGG